MQHAGSKAGDGCRPGALGSCPCRPGRSTRSTTRRCARSTTCPGAPRWRTAVPGTATGPTTSSPPRCASTGRPRWTGGQLPSTTGRAGRRRRRRLRRCSTTPTRPGSSRWSTRRVRRRGPGTALLEGSSRSARRGRSHRSPRTPPTPAPRTTTRRPVRFAAANGFHVANTEISRRLHAARRRRAPRRGGRGGRAAPRGLHRRDVRRRRSRRAAAVLLRAGQPADRRRPDRGGRLRGLGLDAGHHRRAHRAEPKDRPTVFYSLAVRDGEAVAQSDLAVQPGDTAGAAVGDLRAPRPPRPPARRRGQGRQPARPPAGAAGRAAASTPRTPRPTRSWSRSTSGSVSRSCGVARPVRPDRLRPVQIRSSTSTTTRRCAGSTRSAGGPRWRTAGPGTTFQSLDEMATALREPSPGQRRTPLGIFDGDGWSAAASSGCRCDDNLDKAFVFPAVEPERRGPGHRRPAARGAGRARPRAGPDRGDERDVVPVRGA